MPEQTINPLAAEARAVESGLRAWSNHDGTFRVHSSSRPDLWWVVEVAAVKTPEGWRLKLACTCEGGTSRPGQYLPCLHAACVCRSLERRGPGEVGGWTMATGPGPTEEGRMMALNDYEPLTTGPLERSYRCEGAGEALCDGECVTRGQRSDGRLGPPLCFRHAFADALHNDPEARSLALGWAIAEGLKTQKVDGRTR